MAIPSFLQSLTKRNLPNNGGSYSVGTGATANSTPMFPGSISQTPEIQMPPIAEQIARQNPVSEPITKPQGDGGINVPPSLGGGSKVPEADATPDELKQLQSIADELMSKSTSPLGASYLDGNTSGVSDSVALRREMMRDRAQGTGLYSVPKGAFATPEQILGIRKMADNHYNQLINTASEDEKTKATMEKSKPTSLSSMSGTPWLEGLRINGLVQGGTAGERAENLAYLSSLPEERQKALVRSGLYNSMSTGERQKFDSYDEVVAGTQRIASMLPEDIETNPYKYVADKYSVFLGGKGTQKYQDFEATLGRITAPIINNIYGAAVTGSELARAQTFIPDLAVDSTQRVGEKLKNLAAFAEFANDSALAKKAGMPKPALNDYIKKYTGIVDGTYNDPAKDKEALNEINPKTGKNYTQEEIDAFKKSQGFSLVGNTSASTSKVVGGIDLKGYAVDPNQSSAVASIYNKIPEINNAQTADAIIKQLNPRAVITGNQVLTAANQFNLDPKIMLALMQHESKLGTSNVALANNNYGGITWSPTYQAKYPGVTKGTPRPKSEGGYYVKFPDPAAGLIAQAELLSKRKIS